MFLGNAFASSDLSYSYVATLDNSISSIKIYNVIADDLYVTKNVLVHFNWEIPDMWDFNTHLRANFNENLHGGNVSYNQDVVSAIKIKKRFAGDFAWKTIYIKEVVNNEDFTIDFYDYLEPSNREVEYSYVAVIGGVDMDSTSNSVRSEFYNYFIVGAGDECYPMIVDMDNTVTYNRESQIIVSPGSKYPYVVNNGVAKYYSGVINVTFFELDKNCQLKVDSGWEYRNHIDEFLTNGEAKIIKSFEGDMWMVHITNSIPRSNNGHHQLVSQQINWVEGGDPVSIGDLYDNNFINTDVDRE